MTHKRAAILLVACASVFASAPSGAQGTPDSIPVWTSMLATGTADDREIAVGRLSELATLPVTTEDVIIAEMHRVNGELFKPLAPWDEAMSEYWMSLAILTSRIPRKSARIELIPAIGMSSGMARRVATLGDEALPGVLQMIAAGREVPPALTTLGYMWFWADSTGAPLADATRGAIVHAWTQALVASDTAYYLALGVQQGVEAAGDPAFVPLLEFILRMPGVQSDPLLRGATQSSRDRLVARAATLPLAALLQTVERAFRYMCASSDRGARHGYCNQLVNNFTETARHVTAGRVTAARNGLDALARNAERAHAAGIITAPELALVGGNVSLVGTRLH